MSQTNDVTRGGSAIIRHGERRGWELPGVERSVAEEVEQHLARHGLEASSVFHEIVSDLVHLDVHVCAPTEERPFVTLFTTGMADRSMTVPQDCGEWALAELMLCLPADWPLEEHALDTEAHYWPVRLLKSLARLPHAYETWLGPGHTVPNGDPPEPYAPETEMCCALVAPPVTLPPEALRFESNQGPVNIHAVIPLHEREMHLKLEKGTDALYDGFDAAGVSEILDPRREPVTRRKIFGIF